MMETVFYILIGCIFLWLSYKLIKKSTKAASWPTTIGYIVFCDLETSCFWDSDSGRRERSYEVKVTYSYIVGNREYKNDTLAFGYMGSGNKVQQEKILTQLRYAESVRVSYDPDNPKSSVLSYGIHRSIKFLIVLGCSILLLILCPLIPGLVFFTFVSCMTVIWLERFGSERVLLKNLVTH